MRVHFFVFLSLLTVGMVDQLAASGGQAAPNYFPADPGHFYNFEDKNPQEFHAILLQLQDVGDPVTVRFVRCQSTDAGDMHLLAEAVRHNHVQSLVIQNHVPPLAHSLNLHDFLAELLPTLHHQDTLKALMLSGFHWTWQNISDLADALAATPSVHILGLSHDPLTDDAAQEVTDMMRHNPHLKDLNLEGTNLSSQAGLMLANALEHNHTLTDLNLAGNPRIEDPTRGRILGYLVRNRQEAANAAAD